MKAAILHKPHTRVSVEDVDIESPHEGEVLLDIVGAGVCPQRLSLCRWAYHASRTPPGYGA